jgi:hypothetical protein
MGADGMTTRFFASWVRRGAASGILEVDPITGPYAGLATFKPDVTLAKDGAPQPAVPGPELTLLGPGSVVGIDPRQIVRTDPAAGATAVEENYVVIAELARPDLPWLFTPASPNAASRIRPWLVLIVVEAARVRLQPGKPVPRITVSDTELPDLNDSWGWAHVQATVDGAADDATAALGPPSGGNAVSRLMCPRRLQPDTAYLACIVPSTLAGVRAGLGLAPDAGPGVALAWTAGAGQDVVLPVYYSWTFSTGDAGDFKSLVQRLDGVAPDTIAGFGTRTIDVSSPWESPPPLGDGMTIELDGALWIGTDRPGTLTDDARTAFETRMTALLNFPADRQPVKPSDPASDPALSAVAPPIYAGRHAGQVRVPPDPGWLRTLNLDPKRRIAAAFGTRYVQDHQEFLMARAWDQLGAVQEANRLRALAELAAEVADRLHTRHIRTLGQSEIFSFAAPARTRVVVGNTGTLQATAATAPLPSGAVTVAFARLARPLGPLGRRAFNRKPTSMIAKGLGNALNLEPLSPPFDGLGQTLQTAPARITNDATGRMFTRAWQGVVTTERTLPTVGNITAIRKAIDGGVTHTTGFGMLKGGPAILLDFKVPVTVDAASLAGIVTDALLPSSRILRRLDARVQVPTTLGGGNTTSPVMACPHFTAPLALALIIEHQEYLLPGIGNFPDDRVTIMFSNPAWIEAFIAGVNHEMNRELLWREYPTDQRGTPFQYFWPRPDGQPDFPPITSWPLATELGKNGAANGPDPETMLVLLVRSEVLRRYPRTIVYAAPGKIDGDKLALDTGAQWLVPQFLLRLDSKTTVFAFNLTRADVHSNIGAKNAGMYFVFSEPVTGPRFNFDEPSPNPPADWTDLDWGHVPTSRGFAIAGIDVAQPPADDGPDPRQWNRDANDIARIAFARPYRVGYHADQLLAKVPNHG